MKCFKCGVSNEEAELFDAIEDREVIKICGRCSHLESIPVIRRPSNSQLKESERRHTVSERLAHISGIYREPEIKVAPMRSHDFVGERTVKEIVEKRFMDKVQKKGVSGIELINNFNWAITNARKSRRLTREQVARAIGEKEYTLKMIENGIVSSNDLGVITRLENYLGINVIKGAIKEPQKEPINKLAFDSITTKNLTINDLKNLKNKKENFPDKEPDFDGDGEIPDELKIDHEEDDS